MNVLRRLLALVGPPRARLVGSVALGALAVGFGVALLATAGYLISRAAERPPILALTTTIVIVRFLALARPLARYLERLSSHDVALRGLTSVRARVYERLEPLAPAEIASYRRGDLVTRLVADVDALQGLTLRIVGPPVIAATVGLACVLATAAVLPVAALALGTGLLAAGIAVPALAALLARRSGLRQAAARGTLSAELDDLLRSAPELVAYGREDDALERVRRADRALLRIGRRDALVAGIADAAAVLVTGATTVGVLALAVAAHEDGSLDRVLVAALTLLALGAFEAVQPLPGAARELWTVIGSGRRVLDLVEQTPAVTDPVRPAPAPERPAVVAVSTVAARYPGALSPVLRRVDLVLEPGRRVALVGPSGSGKTTVTSLLLRFLDPEAGSVTIGGVDVRELRQEDVRATFALAGQEAHLFDSTIRENLRLGRPGAGDDELWAALRRARLDDWVASLDDGLDTLVGEDGLELSGGQRQRLVLARALLSEAPVLLLDEPTAHLDPATAEALVADVLGVADDRSVLLVTHRPEGLDLVDEVVTLHEGVTTRTTPGGSPP
ncbi:MAG: thiol reductant ABC exporter subunit CydC [Gaiella sp.]